jgi:hypothetical protein
MMILLNRQFQAREVVASRHVRHHVSQPSQAKAPA